MIRLLDARTVGQIAAGEIVERPQSVLKELVENALDSGATRIAVAVRAGGTAAIDVTDDGCGIPPEDLPLALARHATSKLRAAEDLRRIGTLGFRGEGLASIAAVARVRIVSRRADAQVGSAIEAHGTHVGGVVPVAAPPGTRVEVRDLFANVPARLAFLRSPAAEFARMASWLATMALAYPRVAFSLAHEDRRAYDLAADDALAQRLAQVFGPALARELVPLDTIAREVAGVGVDGWLSAPGTDRGDRRLQLLFVNGRLLRTTQLAGSWNGGYAGFAMTRRHPFGVLFLDVDGEDVDPNVHPTKFDVRFRRATHVCEVVRRAIAATLNRRARERLATSFSFAPGATSVESERPAAATAPAFAFATTEAQDEPRADELRILAQIDRTYALAADGRGVVLVDQHAAHERIAYETIARAAERGAPREPLLVPYALELSPGEVERLLARRDDLAAAGCEVEPFGENCVRVRTTPAGYGARPIDVRAMIGDLDDAVPGLGARERLWATLACHSVARAGDRLELAELAALVVRLQACENPMHCPHGRPTMIRLEGDAIARLFKRI